MRANARAVIIGGGVVGCSVLYHLAKAGWKDIVLLERDELTSGSTWHAAGGMHTINGDPNVAKLQQYTIDLYKEIQEISGQEVGMHLTGGVLLAATQARMDWLKSLATKGSYLGIQLDVITPEQAVAEMPLLDPSKFVGGLRSYSDGHLDPSGVTHAYAKAAKILGGEIERFTKVEGLTQQSDGQWKVTTNKGDIIAEHVVNAGGLWAREVGRMVGLDIPVLAMEHMYLLTEDMPEISEWNEKTGKEVMHAVDFDGELYLRQERGGMLMGTYEKACVPWSPKSTPWDFGHELLEPDLDRIAPSLEVGFEHFPAFQNAGIKQVINGPFTFAPDGNPLIGPVRGLQNYWCACGVMAGFSQGGGVGLALTNWMTHGDPGMDVWAMDIARYGSWATPSYTRVKVPENYSRRFSIRYPNEELPAGRPLRTVPIHDRLEASGAQFADSWGLEVPLWFAPEGESDTFSWYRSNDFEHVGEEVAGVRKGVGLCEISGFAKYRIDGPGAREWLDRVLACRIPKAGRMTLAPMLKHDGKVIGDFTLSNVDDENFLLIGSGVAEDYHMRWFESVLPNDGSVHVECYGLTKSGLAIAGPKSRELLQAICEEDVSGDKFRFMDIKALEIGFVRCLVGRVSYTGDLGYEIWCDAAYQRRVFDLLIEKGEGMGLKLFGSRALNSLRLEKNYGSWAREYRPIYDAHECGLSAFVADGKDADFIGKQAHIKAAARKDGLRLCAFKVEVSGVNQIADVAGDEPIYRDGKAIGWVTSGGYAHNCACSVAMGYIPANLADQKDGWEVDIIGRKCSASILAEPLFDANGQRMRKG